MEYLMTTATLSPWALQCVPVFVLPLATAHAAQARRLRPAAARQAARTKLKPARLRLTPLPRPSRCTPRLTQLTPLPPAVPGMLAGLQPPARSQPRDTHLRYGKPETGIEPQRKPQQQ